MQTSHAPDARAPKRRVRRLLLLNAALALAAVASTLAVARAKAQPTARAADGLSERPRGDYTMIAGRIQGSTTQAVYVLDSTNQEMLALRWDRNTNKFEIVGYRSLIDDNRFLRTPR